MNIEMKYRPIPFWSWNDKLEPQECRRQIREMKAQGIGGFFMHARGGLETGYMSEEWFETVSACIDEAKKCGMEPWMYDENGWPSGAADGAVCGLGVEYQQKKLKCEPGEGHTRYTIGNCGGYHFYYDVNPYYIDILNKDAVKRFIEAAYEPYYSRYKNGIKGFFTDEPQLGMGEYPWSTAIEEAFYKRCGEELLPHLPELYFPVGNYRRTRIRFWKLVTDLFSESYCKQIYDWCDSRGLMFTGHLLAEESIASQTFTCGAVMPHYEFFHMPGVDFLGRNKDRAIVPLQVGSVARQLGKKQTLTECYAMCGHGIGHDELKAIAEVQMVRGVTTVCQHLQGYSMRGIRKRDFPPAMSYQQPWWEYYKSFNDILAYTGKLLSEGEVICDTLFIPPQTEAWALYDGTQNKAVEQCNARLLAAINELEAKHIIFHLGDETILERHARAENGKLIVGNQSYSRVLIWQEYAILDNTRALLEKFAAQGGEILPPEKTEADDVIDNPAIVYTKRKISDGIIYYLVNTTSERQTSKVKIGDTQKKYCFAPFESKLLRGGGSEEAIPNLKPLPLDGEWTIRSISDNSLTLDFCDCYFDDVLIQKNMYVIDIQKRACELKRPVRIRCDFKAEMNYLPNPLYLVCETPEKLEITVNGVKIEGGDEGFFKDISFRRLDISKYIRRGENIISLSTLFTLSEETYDNIDKARLAESVKNKLTFEMEIEPVYLTGSFTVGTSGKFIGCEDGISRYTGRFTVEEPAEKITLKEIEKQGFPFFAGEMVLEKNINIQDINYGLSFNKCGINLLNWQINDRDAGTYLWQPYYKDVSGLLQKGENRLQVTIVNNLRNLLGPHHSEGGEGMIGPSSFYREAFLWDFPAMKGWTSDYKFAVTSIAEESTRWDI